MMNNAYRISIYWNLLIRISFLDLLDQQIQEIGFSLWGILSPKLSKLYLQIFYKMNES